MEPEALPGPSATLDAIVLVLPDEQDLKHYRMRYPKIAEVVAAASRRQDSVWQGFRLLDPATTEIVLVHDGARPLVDAPTSSAASSPRPRADGRGRARPAARRNGQGNPGRALRRDARPDLPGPGANAPGVPLRRAEEGPGRGAAGPVLRHGRSRCSSSGSGCPVTAVEGDPRNIKITTPLDLKIAEGLLDA